MATTIRSQPFPGRPRSDSVVSRTADATPLGLAAFAATILMFSVVNADVIAGAALPAVLGMALFFGGTVQVLAGMWEFRRGNSFAGVALSAYGGFWLSYWGFRQFYVGQIPAGHLSHALGLYLLVWGIFTSYMILASLRVNVAVALFFIALTVTFWLLMAGEFAGSAKTIEAGGYAGMVTAFFAFYASFAGVVNDTWKRTLIPVFPLGPRPTADVDAGAGGEEQAPRLAA